MMRSLIDIEVLKYLWAFWFTRTWTRLMRAKWIHDPPEDASS
jgi:hypothetical protein